MESGMEETELYESLPPTTTVGTYMLAGAMAGMGEHCVMYPFDCVKVRCEFIDALVELSCVFIGVSS